jgi:hypothetical protein
MLKIRIVAGLLLALSAGRANTQTPAPPAPSKEWADYISAMLKVDGIEDAEARCRAYPD